MAEELPQDIRHFLSTHISSVVQMELLLLLRSTAPRAWTGQEIADELCIDPAWAEVQADALCKSGLLMCERDSASQYTYQARDAATDDLVARAAAAYAERRVAIITFLYSQPSSPIKALAEAFRFRKGRTNG